MKIMPSEITRDMKAKIVAEVFAGKSGHTGDIEAIYRLIADEYGEIFIEFSRYESLGTSGDRRRVRSPLYRPSDFS
jgi:hypothetical protein